MYKVHVEQNSGDFDMTITFTTADRNTASINKKFRSISNADACFQDHFHDWLMEQLKKYVYHAEFLFIKADNKFYATESKINALTRLKDLVEAGKGTNTRSLVLRILAHEKDILFILPSVKNNSYESSNERAQDIIKQCIRYNRLFIKIQT